jgi:hypothetical protein
MMNIVGVIKESLTLKEDVMLKQSTFLERKNLKYMMPLSLEQSWRM